MTAKRTPLAAFDLLVAIDTTGSISAAARLLSLSQPTVSVRIRELERAVGMALVRRTPQGSSLTEHGEVLAQWGRDVLHASDVFEANLAALRGSARDPLVVAASMTIAEHLLPSWLATWRRLKGRAPDGPSSALPPIELLVRNSADVMRAVLDRRADIGYVEGKEVLPGLEGRRVAEDELVVVVGRHHRWAQRPTPLSARELVTGGLILREKGSGTRDVLESVLEAAGVALPADLPQLGSTSAIKSTLLEGDTAAVISVLAVRAELETGMLVRVPVTGLKLRRRLVAVKRSGERLSPGARELLGVSVSGKQVDSGEADPHRQER